MSDFVYDEPLAEPPGPKVDLAPLSPLADPTKWVTAAEFNSLREELKDLRAALRGTSSSSGKQFLGLAPGGSVAVSASGRARFRMNPSTNHVEVSENGGDFVALGVAQNVADMAALRLRDVADDDVVMLAKHTVAKGQGGGIFYWDPTCALTDDNGTIIQKTGESSGRWRRVYDGEYLNVCWFGAVGDGTTDCTDAIQATVDALPNGGGYVLIPQGDWLISSQILAQNHSTHIRGAGTGRTRIFFDPDGEDPSSCFLFQLASATIISGCSISHMTFKSANTSVRKTAVDLYDVSEFSAHDLRLTEWYGGSSTMDDGSCGIRVRGREFVWIRNCTLACPMPIQISSNPNNPSDCFDQSSIRDCYLIGTSADHNVVHIDSGVTVGPVAIDQVHMNSGANGLYWDDNTSAARSDSIKVTNLRYEQSAIPATGGWAIWLNKHDGAQGGGFSLEHFSGGNVGDYNGVYIRGFSHTLIHCEFQGDSGSTGLDIDSGPGIHIDCSFSLNGAVVNYNSMIKVFATDMASGASPQFACWDRGDRADQFLNISFFNNRQRWADAPPDGSMGTWNVGDFTWNTDATDGGKIGWICTATGAPGTWNAVRCESYNQLDTNSGSSATPDISVHLMPSNSAMMVEFTTVVRRTGGSRGTGAVGDAAVFKWLAAVKMPGDQGSVDAVVVGAVKITDGTFIDADLAAAGVDVGAPVGLPSSFGYIKLPATRGAADLDLTWITTKNLLGMNPYLP